MAALVAQCSATPATAAATPPCSATPFQTQISVRHTPGTGGERCDTKIFRGCSATPVLHPAKRYKIQEISCDTCSATRVARQGGTRNRVQLRWPQETSHKILHISPHALNQILSLRDSGVGGPNFFDKLYGLGAPKQCPCEVTLILLSLVFWFSLVSSNQVHSLCVLSMFSLFISRVCLGFRGVENPGVLGWFSGKKKAHKHKSFWPVTPPVTGGSPDRGGQESKFMYYLSEPKEHKSFCPDTRPEDRWPERPEKIMCKSYMCLRSRPGKPNQRKGQNKKFMNFAHFCEFWCFSLGKQARFTLNFCSGMPPRKVHELPFL